MNNKMFTGWKDVFRFTFKQETKGKGFKLTTIGITLVCMILMIIINVSMASGQGDSGKEKKAYKSPVKTVYVENESDLVNMDFSTFGQIAGEGFDKVKFQNADKKSEELLKELGSKENKSFVLLIKNKDQSYSVQGIIPANSKVDAGDADKIIDVVKISMQQSMVQSTGLKPEQIALAAAPVSSDYSEAGKEENFGAELLKILLPMAVVLILYTMIMIYGQSMGKIVSAEKTSKLMETLLLSVRPYSIIMGKIVAMTSLAIMQFLLWMAGLFAGFFIGDKIAVSMNPGYENPVYKVLRALRDMGVGSAFEPASVILCMISICLGFFFFCVVAGMIASTINKAEELSQGMSIFQMIVVITFLLTYILPYKGGAALYGVLRVIPFSASFILGSDIILGNITIVQGILYCMLLLAFTIGAIVLAGKIYRDQVFYRGTKSAWMKIFGK